ncbi:MAG: DUF692 domain-containing protein, partial [Pseudomonadota bacterium]
VDGGPRLDWLDAIRQDRALSLHGVGASLGSLDPYDQKHINGLCSLIDRYEPEQVSEHAAWCSHDGNYYADLLPLPRTDEARQHLINRVTEFQELIGRQILIENPTNYLDFAHEIMEPDFLCDVARSAGCGVLLDVNNVWISANNVGLDPHGYIRALPADLVGEIHIAGHEEDPNLGAAMLIDSHNAPVAEGVWGLLEVALEHLGPKPVLVERDSNIPAFTELLAERDRAEQVIKTSDPNRPVHALAS